MKLVLAVGFWCVVTAATALLIFIPISIEAQLALGITLLTAMLVLRLFPPNPVLRQIFFAFGTILILRYAYWRVTSTLPPSDQLTDFVPGVILLGAELFCLFMLGLSLFVIADPLTRKKAPAVAKADLPTVDIFVPSFNEPVEIVSVTLAAAKAIAYPKGRLNVYLLDDGSTDAKLNSVDRRASYEAAHRKSAMQALCQELGVHYVARPNNNQAKAGNLNYGMTVSSGEFIVVLDADHVPSRDFLTETIGHLVADERLFLVQTPHFFINPDPIEKNLSTFSRMPSENEMFYGVIQKGLDKWNSAFFCGSAAVLRRTAIEEAGGFSGSSITEDCETALDLHARGWRSLYVDIPLIAGLQPQTFESFIGQRSRWCRGMIQIMLMKNPFIKSGLTFAQRLCYAASSFFWLFPLPRMIFLAAPLFYIFFDLKIYQANLQEFIAYTCAYMLAAVLLQNYAYGRVRWPWISELYEYVQSIYLIRAIVGVFLNPRAPKFNVTAKDQTLAEDRLSSLAWPYFLVFFVLLAAAGVTVYRYQYEPDARGLLTVVGLWNLFNLMMAGAALGVVAELRERRRIQRLPSSYSGMLAVGAAHIPVEVEDLSWGGARLRPFDGSMPFPRGTLDGVLTVVDHDGRENALHVALANAKMDDKGVYCGVRFTAHGTAKAAMISNLIYADLSLLRDTQAARWRNARGVLGGTFAMLLLGLRQMGRGFYYALFNRGSKAEPKALAGAELMSPAE